MAKQIMNMCHRGIWTTFLNDCSDLRSTMLAGRSLTHIYYSNAKEGCPCSAVAKKVCTTCRGDL